MSQPLFLPNHHQSALPMQRTVLRMNQALIPQMVPHSHNGHWSKKTHVSVLCPCGLIIHLLHHILAMINIYDRHSSVFCSWTGWLAVSTKHCEMFPRSILTIAARNIQLEFQIDKKVKNDCENCKNTHFWLHSLAAMAVSRVTPHFRLLIGDVTLSWLIWSIWYSMLATWLLITRWNECSQMKIPSISVHMIQESREIYETPSPTKQHVSHLPSDFSIASSSRATSTLKLALEDSPPKWLDESSPEPLSPRTLGKMSMANRLKYSDSVSIDDCSKWEKEKKMKHEIRKSITSTLVGQFSTPKLIERLSKSALHTVQAPPLLPSQAQHILYWNDMSLGTENVVCCASKTMNDDYKSGLIHMTWDVVSL